MYPRVCHHDVIMTLTGYACGAASVFSCDFISGASAVSVSADPHNVQGMKRFAPQSLVVPTVNSLSSFRCHSVHRNCTS